MLESTELALELISSKLESTYSRVDSSTDPAKAGMWVRALTLDVGGTN